MSGAVDPLPLSFAVALLATALCALLGVALGALLASPRLPGRDLLEAVLTAPLVLPPTVLGYYLLVALGRRSALGAAIEAVTGSPLVFSRAGAVVAATVGGLPLTIRAARGAIESVDPLLVKAARALGAGPLRALLTVQLPLASRGILAGLTLSFARALGDFGVTLMVAGNIAGQTRTASLAIYDAIQAGHDERAAGQAALLAACSIGALYLVGKLTAPRWRR
jgi:molybdate transport system permease protein